MMTVSKFMNHQQRIPVLVKVNFWKEINIKVKKGKLYFHVI